MWLLTYLASQSRWPAICRPFKTVAINIHLTKITSAIKLSSQVPCPWRDFFEALIIQHFWSDHFGHLCNSVCHVTDRYMLAISTISISYITICIQEHCSLCFEVSFAIVVSPQLYGVVWQTWSYLLQMQEQGHIGYIICMGRHCRLCCNVCYSSMHFSAQKPPFTQTCKIIMPPHYKPHGHIMDKFKMLSYPAFKEQNNHRKGREFKWHLTLVGCLVSSFKTVTNCISVVVTRKAYTHTHYRYGILPHFYLHMYTPVQTINTKSKHSHLGWMGGKNIYMKMCALEKVLKAC